MKLMLMIALTITITMIVILPKVRIEAADLSMVKVVINILEASHFRSRGQRPQYNQHQFQNYQFQGGTYQQNHTQYGNNRKPYFQGN